MAAKRANVQRVKKTAGPKSPMQADARRFDSERSHHLPPVPEHGTPEQLADYIYEYTQVCPRYLYTSACFGCHAVLVTWNPLQTTVYRWAFTTCCRRNGGQ